MDLGFELNLRQSQKLIITPELQQALKILQFSAVELHEYIQNEMEDNLFLEVKEETPDEIKPEGAPLYDRSEPVDWKEYFRNQESYYDKENVAYQADESEYSYENMVPHKSSLHEHLLLQLDLHKLSETDKKIATFMIESLDENGYLRISKLEIASILNVDRNKITKILKLIQGFDPPGVGARSLRECLIIQLKQKGMLTSTVRNIVLEHLKDLAANRYNLIAKKMGISTEEVQRIGDMIKTLEPKPGRGFSSAQFRYAHPDVIIEKINDEYIILVNDAATPRLQVNPFYKELLESCEDEETAAYLSKGYQSAMWLIKSIDQRRATLGKVVDAIVKFQKDFFDKGILYLKPMNLKDVAEDAEVHESTVSRAISGKYVQTPRGIFEIKYFFSSGVNASDGEGVSSESVKRRIKEIIDGENAAKPLSDSKITEILNKEGIDISRRTVAKYREEMGIPSSQGRKRY
jgi:RNA polymerase sigma-54 factor